MNIYKTINIKNDLMSELVADPIGNCCHWMDATCHTTCRIKWTNIVEETFNLCDIFGCYSSEDLNGNSDIHVYVLMSFGIKERS